MHWHIIIGGFWKCGFHGISTVVGLLTCCTAAAFFYRLYYFASFRVGDHAKSLGDQDQKRVNA